MLISGLDSKIKLLDIEIQKHCGQHTVCQYTLLLHDDISMGSCHEKVGSNVTVMLDDEYPVFVGRIESVGVHKTISGRTAVVKAVSLSILSDETPHTRIFQNSKKTFGQVLSKTNLKMTKVGLKLDSELGSKSCKDIVIQKDETDFQFICRLADKLNYPVWIDDAMEQPVLWVAKKRKDAEVQWKQEEIVSYIIEKRKGQQRVVITSRHYTDPGSWVRLEDVGGKYLVMGITIRREHGIDIFHYELMQQEQTKDKINEKSIHEGINLQVRAVVQDNKDPKNLGRLKVKFHKDDIEEVEAGERTWLDYRSPYTGKESGIVFLPDKDDEVEVLFTNGNCLVCSAGRQEKSLMNECQKVDNKYIGNNYKRRMIWKEKSLEFLSGENKIIMDDEKIELKVKDTSLILNKDSITLKANGNTIYLGKDIKLECNKNVLITGKDTEIKGSSSMRVKSGGEVNIKGSRVNIS